MYVNYPNLLMNELLRMTDVHLLVTLWNNYGRRSNTELCPINRFKKLSTIFKNIFPKIKKVIKYIKYLFELTMKMYLPWYKNSFCMTVFLGLKLAFLLWNVLYLHPDLISTNLLSLLHSTVIGDTNLSWDFSAFSFRMYFSYSFLS